MLRTFSSAILQLTISISCEKKKGLDDAFYFYFPACRGAGRETGIPRVYLLTRGVWLGLAPPQRPAKINLASLPMPVPVGWETSSVMECRRSRPGRY